MKSGSNSNRFYEKLAPVYDLKVDWESRHDKEQKLFRYLLDTLKPTRVLDIGCGDGGHAPLYAAARIEYLGIDLSQEMIAKARSKYAQLPGVRFETGDMARLPAKFKESFDQIIVLGNTLPHLLTQQALDRAITQMSRSLVGSGNLILQTVNPAPLKKKQLHFLPAKLSGETIFAPFYLQAVNHWDFHMPIYQVGDRGCVLRSAEVTRLRFWSKAQIAASAKDANLKLRAAFGNAGLDPYNPTASENMILIFGKN